MKQELRCHAVLCPKEDKAKEMASNLQDRLHQALIDFKKEKISRQNARLSLANCIHDNPSMPYRKLLLQAGTNNYKPPIERSKSAPKLTSIEEAELEEEEEAEYEYEEEEEEENDDTEDQLELRHIAEVHIDPLTFRLGEAGQPRVPPLPLSTVSESASSSGIDTACTPPLVAGYLPEESEDTEDEDEITDYLGSGGGGDGGSSGGGELMSLTAFKRFCFP